MRLKRTTGLLSGLLIAILGIWGALVPFIGPYFNYSFGSNATWHYTTDRLWLCIVPGAVALLGGLMMISASRRGSGIVGGWLAVIAGAWFAVGPAVSLTWESGQGPIGRPLYGSTRQMLELVGYFYGLGALIVALAAFAIGRFASVAVVREAPVAPVAGEDAAPAAAPAATRRPHGARRGEERLERRRLPFLRRGRRAGARGEGRVAQAPGSDA